MCARSWVRQPAAQPAPQAVRRPIEANLRPILAPFPSYLGLIPGDILDTSQAVDSVHSINSIRFYTDIQSYSGQFG